MVNHQIPMGKDKKTYGKSSEYLCEKIAKLMINHQIPMGKDEKTYGKPSDSYEKRYENLW